MQTLVWSAKVLLIFFFPVSFYSKSGVKSCESCGGKRFVPQRERHGSTVFTPDDCVKGRVSKQLAEKLKNLFSNHFITSKVMKNTYSKHCVRFCFHWQLF